MIAFKHAQIKITKKNVYTLKYENNDINTTKKWTTVVGLIRKKEKFN